MAFQIFTEDFTGRCLPFDQKATLAYALIVASRKRFGQPISVEDAQIASIAVTRKCTLATRNVRDFAAIDNLILMDPWPADKDKT